jgi:hypothetical protein
MRRSVPSASATTAQKRPPPRPCSQRTWQTGPGGLRRRGGASAIGIGAATGAVRAGARGSSAMKNSSGSGPPRATAPSAARRRATAPRPATRMRPSAVAIRIAVHDPVSGVSGPSTCAGSRAAAAAARDSAGRASPVVTDCSSG